MGDSIWIVSSNEQDDYSPVAVFDRAFDAENFTNWAVLCGENVGFGELPYNPTPDDFPHFKSRINCYVLQVKRDGQVKSCRETGDIKSFGNQFYLLGGSTNAHLDCIIWARNQRQALGIARRQVKDLIDSGEWRE